MESITKTKLSLEQINTMVKKAFGDGEKAASIMELDDGFFNSAFKVSLENGQEMVLKVAPSNSIKLMRYEANIMETEVYVLNQIGTLDEVPAPKVLYYDNSRAVINSEYFFMEYIHGTPLNKIADSLSEDDLQNIDIKLGTYVKKINGLKNDYFGYISQKDKRFNTWGEAFLFMIRELLEDAADKNVVLPYSYQTIYKMVQNKLEVLNQVKTPSLVHKDLWQGNIFVNSESSEIMGIIDCERAIYGDALLELVCGFLLNNKCFMKSYCNGEPFSRDEQIRIILYKIYLFLIMVIECEFRKYPTEDNYNWSKEQLDLAFLEYKQLC